MSGEKTTGEGKESTAAEQSVHLLAIARMQILANNPLG